MSDNSRQTIGENIVVSSSMRAGGAPRDDNATLANEIDASTNASSQAEDNIDQGNVAIAADSGRSGPSAKSDRLCMQYHGRYRVYGYVECLCLQPKADAAAVMSWGSETLDVDDTVRAESDLGDDLDGSTAVAETRQSGTAVGSEVSEEGFIANFPGEGLALMVAIRRVAQPRRRPSMLPGLADEAILLIFETGHAAQDSRRDLMGIGALFGKYIDRGRLDAYTDEYLDPAAMKRLFDNDGDHGAEVASSASLQEA